MSKHTTSCFDRWTGDERGNVAMMFALLSTVIALGAGAGIDFGRRLNVETHTQRALDAAVLAGGRTLQMDNTHPEEAVKVAKAVYTENVKTRLPVAADNVSFTMEDNNTSLLGKSSTTIKTYFLGLGGRQTLSASNRSKTQIAVGGEGGSNLEVSIMLDVTGSMCADGNGPCTTSTKMDAMKTAAKDLVDIVVWNDQTTKTARVALVPFSTRVRVEPDGQGGPVMKKLTNLDPTWSGWYDECKGWTGSGGGGGTSEGGGSGGSWTCTGGWEHKQATNWKVMPCVTDRFYNDGWQFDITDDKPGAGAWLNAHDGGRFPLSADSSNIALTSGTGKTSSDPANQWNYDPWGGGGECADIRSANLVMPLTSDKTALKKRIDDLEAYGSTAGALGTAWAWYMLSPNWTSIWPGNDGAMPYNLTKEKQSNGAPKLRKIAILLTDGVYNTYRGWKDQDQKTVSEYATQLCGKMKNQGIDVYTVAFDLDSLPGGERKIAEDTLKSCATSGSTFYDAIDAAQLKQAFRDIALKLSSLYLSE